MNELRCEEEMKKKKKKKKKRKKTKEEMLKLEVGTDCLFVVIIFTDAAGPTFSICQFVLFTLNWF
jgi:hypothetical protein